MEVIVLVLDEHSEIIDATFRNLSLGVPVMRSTSSGVYWATWAFSRFHTQRGCWRVSSTTA